MGDFVEKKSDDVLVAACLRGETEAYAELGKGYARRLYAICLAIVDNAADAEDLTQETLVKGFMELASLRDNAKFGPWIAAIATNVSRDLLRKRASERGPAVVETDCPPAETERLMDLRRALSELPEQHRIPLLLYYLDGHSTESVAATLGISTAAVHQRLSRARRELRGLIESKEV